MNRVLRITLYLLLLFLFPFSRAFSQPSRLLKQPATASYGDQLVYGIPAEHPFRMNPFEINSTDQHEILALIFGYGLIKSEGKVAAPPPLIARQFAEDNSKTWHIVLKRNIIFHNDVNLRNTDVKFTFELVKKYGGYILNRHFDLANVRSIEINGDLETVFHLFRPDKNFISKLADIPIIPQSYYREAMFRGYRIFSNLPPMGMGPFSFEFQTQNILSLKYHLNYYSGRPFLNRVKVLFFDDQQKLVSALVNGRVDYIELPDRVTTDRLFELMSNKMIMFGIPRRETRVYTLLFNVTKFPLSESEVRKAIYLAINRKNIVTKFAKNVGSVATSLFEPGNPAYEKTLFQDTYNPRQALRLLKKAGWVLNPQTLMLEKNGRPLSFKLNFSKNSELEQNIARAIKLNLAEININVQPVPVPQLNKDNLLQKTAYESMVYCYAYDPKYLLPAVKDFFFDVLGAGQNVPNYRNRYMKRLFGLVKNRPGKYKDVYIRFQTFLAREVPTVLLFFDERILIGLDKRFRDFRKIIRKDKTMYFQLNPIENWFVPKAEQKYP